MPVAPRTQNLVRHLAYKYPRPNIERRTRYVGEKGIYATTQYVYVFLPEDGIDHNIVATDSGYSGSSKDHYYRSMGVTEEASRLSRRERACGCQPCLKLLISCILTPANTGMSAGTTPQATTVSLAPARPAPEARQTRNARNPLPEFCEGLAVGQNIIVRVSNDEKKIIRTKIILLQGLRRKQSSWRLMGCTVLCHTKRMTG